MTTAQAGFPLEMDDGKFINRKDTQMGRATTRYLHPAISTFIDNWESDLTSSGKQPSPLEQAGTELENLLESWTLIPESCYRKTLQKNHSQNQTTVWVGSIASGTWNTLRAKWGLTSETLQKIYDSCKIQRHLETASIFTPTRHILQTLHRV
jgi:hypothetical protein